MKRIVIALATLAVAFAALRISGPALTNQAREKCLEMLEGASSPCSPTQATTSTVASCSGPSSALQ
jgi:hypothetical protein